MPERYGWKLPATFLGGLALLGIFLWQAIRFWMAYSSVGGGLNLTGAIVCSLLIVAWLAAVVKLTL